MNETLSAISKRFSCRDFDGATPTNKQLKAIAAAAIAAPSANNSQRWKVIVVKNKALIDELEAEAMNSIVQLPDKTLYNNFASRGGVLFYHAPCVVFVATEAQADLDCGIVCQNIALVAGWVIVKMTIRATATATARATARVRATATATARVRATARATATATATATARVTSLFPSFLPRACRGSQ